MGLRSLDEHFRLGYWSDFRKRELAILYPWRLTIQVVRQMQEDRLLVRASSLAFFTVLSLIPVLAVAGSLLVAFGDNQGTALLDNLQKHIVPVAGEGASTYLMAAFERAMAAGLGPVGTLALIITAVALFMQIERVFNDVWKVKKRRPLYVRVLLFYALLTVGPLVLSVSLYEATQVSNEMERMGPLGYLAAGLSPIATGTLLYFLMYKLFPHTRVRWSSALIGGLVAASLFTSAKWGFNLYVNYVFEANYDAIYGPMGMIPVFLLWIYISWVVTLFGAELSYAIQNLRSLMMSDKVQRKLGESSLSTRGFPGSLFPLEIYAPIARGFAESDIPVPLARVCAESGYSREIVEEGLHRLAEAGLLVAVETEERHGFVPRRPLNTIELQELLDVFEVQATKPELTPALRGLLARSMKARTGALRGLDAEALVSKPAHNDKKSRST